MDQKGKTKKEKNQKAEKVTDSMRKKRLGSSGEEISDKIPLKVATNILRNG